MNHVHVTTDVSLGDTIKTYLADTVTGVTLEDDDLWEMLKVTLDDDTELNLMVSRQDYEELQVRILLLSPTQS